MRQPRQRAIGDDSKVLELEPPARLPGKRRHDAELEVTHARLSLELRVEGGRQQGESGDQLKPRTPLVMVQRSRLLR